MHLRKFSERLVSVYGLSALCEGMNMESVEGKETFTVDTRKMSEHLKTEEEELDRILDIVYVNFKPFIKKRLLRDGSISFTYK